MATALAALHAGLVAVFVLLPAARLIPKRLNDQWRMEAEFALQNPTADAVEYAYTAVQKVLLVLGAALVGAFVIWRYGTESNGIAHAFYFLCLVLLVAINLKHELLPDVVVFTALWAGLLFQASSGHAADAIHGAAAGYLAPFLLSLAFKVFTGKDVIGQGDLKALAMAGAWFGLSAVPVLLGAVIVGFVVWVVGVRLAGMAPRGLVPTGPAHLFASLVVASGVRAF